MHQRTNNLGSESNILAINIYISRVHHCSQFIWKCNSTWNLMKILFFCFYLCSPAIIRIGKWKIRLSENPRKLTKPIMPVCVTESWQRKSYSSGRSKPAGGVTNVSRGICRWMTFNYSATAIKRYTVGITWRAYPLRMRHGRPNIASLRSRLQATRRLWYQLRLCVPYIWSG